MKITNQKTDKNVAKISIEIDRSEINHTQDHVVDEMVENVTVKGFRQGKAPKNLAVKQLDPDKLTDRVLNHVLNSAITQILNEQDLHLFGRPVLEKIDSEGEAGWKIELGFPLFPKFDLPDYKSIISNLKKNKSESEDKESKTKQTDKVYDELLKNSNIDIPKSVIDEEINISLERLANQAKAINLSLESYLKAVGKTIEEIKDSYAKGAEESLKLDLILLEIGKKEGIKASETEIQETLKTAGLPDTQANRVKSIIERRKTIDFLENL